MTSFPSRGLLMAGVLAAAVGAAASVAAAQPFTFTLVPQEAVHVYAGAATWGDFDRDGDLDLLMSGRGAERLVTRLYRNGGAAPDGARLTDAGADLPGLAHSAAAWADYDGDGDLDFVLTGSLRDAVPYQPFAALYRNDGGTFTAEPAAALDGVHSGAAAWADYDGDGDPDLLLTGTASTDAPYLPVTHLYRNDGGGRFQAQAHGLEAVTFGEARWGDYDRDGDPDVVLTGLAAAGRFFACVYRNDGGRFAVQAELPGAAFSAVDWGDYDGDGDLDLVLSGGRSSAFLLDGRTKIYRNDGGRFVDVDAGLVGTLAGEAAWGDYDLDGDLDLLVLGATRPLDRYAARIYENRSGGFEAKALLVGVVFGAASWGDYDGDGDLDLITAGLAHRQQESGSNEVKPNPPVTNLYRNDWVPEHPVPPTPAGLAARVDGRTVVLRWAAAEAPGLTYNLQVGTAPGRPDVLAPLSDVATGRRQVTAPGNADRSTHWRLRDLHPGTYYWGVQAVNGAFGGSAFADGGSFTVGAVPTDVAAPADVPDVFTLYGTYPNPFHDAATLRYGLPRAGVVEVRIYNVLGERVRTLHSARQPAGVHTLTWDGATEAGTPAAAGLYLYDVRVDGAVHGGRMVLVR